MIRANFKGKTYMLIDPPDTTMKVLCNAINTGILAHVGSVEKHELLGWVTTPQVYRVAEDFYASVVQGKSQFVNRIWLMRAFDLIPTAIPAL